MAMPKIDEVIFFHDWLKLTPSTEIKPEEAELMYIIISKPLDL